MDQVFQALAHPARRRLLDLIKERPGCNVNDVCAGFDISRIAAVRHLDKLEDAGLVVSERDGRNRRLYFNVVPLQLVYDRWTHEYSAWWAERLVDIKYAVETKQEDEP